MVKAKLRLLTMGGMERRAEKFTSFEAADRATKAYYHSLTPDQRIEILLDLIERSREGDSAAEHRLAPVYRIVKLPRG
jgi:hypothetical protein